MAVYTPALMLQDAGPMAESFGYPVEVAYIVVKACLGIVLWGAAVVGFLFARTGDLGAHPRLRRRRAPGACPAAYRRGRLRAGDPVDRLALVADTAGARGCGKMSLCILAGGKVTVLAVAAFTLSWTHSVERTRWEEDWKITPAGLQIVEARVKGSGAGMEPPEGAALENGWWVYAPKHAAQSGLTLAASGATGAGWTLCAAQACIELGAVAGDAIELSACSADPTMSR